MKYIKFFLINLVILASSSIFSMGGSHFGSMFSVENYQLEREIIYAASNGDYDLLNKLVLENKGRIYFNFSLNPALIAAINKKNYKIIKCLLEVISNLFSGDKYKEALIVALFESCKKGDLYLINYLIGKKVNINAQDLDGRTVLMLFAKNGNFKAVDFLLEFDPIVDMKDNDGYTALFYACEKGFKNIVNLLLSIKGHFSDVNEIDNNLRSPIIVAVRYGHKEIVEILIKEGAKISQRDKFDLTALDLALSYGHKDIVDTLINADVNFKGKDLNGNGFLISATKSGNYELCKMLIDKYAINVNEKDMNGNTSLLIAVNNNKKEIVELMLKNGAKVNVCNFSKETALLKASSDGNHDIINILLKAGANIFSKNYKGLTPINFISKYPEIKIIDERRAQIEKYKKLLFDAVSSADYEKGRELSKLVSMGVYDEKGNNPLHIALNIKINDLDDFCDVLKEKKRKIVELIFKIRPELIVEKNNFGQRPLQIFVSDFEYRKILFEFLNGTRKRSREE